jgi:hypothetical protein
MASILLAYPFTKRLTLLYSKHQHKTMQKLQYRFLVLLSILALGCQQKTKQKEVLSTENSFNVLTKILTR